MVIRNELDDSSEGLRRSPHGALEKDEEDQDEDLPSGEPTTSFMDSNLSVAAADGRSTAEGTFGSMGTVPPEQDLFQDVDSSFSFEEYEGETEQISFSKDITELYNDLGILETKENPVELVEDQAGLENYVPASLAIYKQAGFEISERVVLEKYKPAGSENSEPVGPENCKPAWSENYEPAGSEIYEPAGSENYEPASTGSENYEPASAGSENYEPVSVQDGDEIYFNLQSKDQWRELVESPPLVTSVLEQIHQLQLIVNSAHSGTEIALEPEQGDPTMEQVEAPRCFPILEGMELKELLLEQAAVDHDPGLYEPEEYPADSAQDPGLYDPEEYPADSAQDPGLYEPEEHPSDVAKDPGIPEPEEHSADSCQDPRLYDPEEHPADSFKVPGLAEPEEHPADSCPDPGLYKPEEHPFDAAQDPGISEPEEHPANSVLNPGLNELEEHPDFEQLYQVVATDIDNRSYSDIPEIGINEQQHPDAPDTEEQEETVPEHKEKMDEISILYPDLEDKVKLRPPKYLDVQMSSVEAGDEHILKDDCWENTRDDSTDARDENPGARDENTDATDENPGARDENPGARDENTDARDENTDTKDENTDSKDENTGVRDENTCVMDDNTGVKDENTGVRDENTGVTDENTGVRDDEDTGGDFTLDEEKKKNLALFFERFGSRIRSNSVLSEHVDQLFSESPVSSPECIDIFSSDFDSDSSVRCSSPEVQILPPPHGASKISVLVNRVQTSKRVKSPIHVDVITAESRLETLPLRPAGTRAANLKFTADKDEIVILAENLGHHKHRVGAQPRGQSVRDVVPSNESNRGEEDGSRQKISYPETGKP